MSDKIEAIVLAGGKGTRLAPLTDNLPKPLVKILDKEIILYVLEHLRAHGIRNVALSVAHLGAMIEAFLGDGSSLGMKISYLREPTPMGTGGWTQLVNWDDLAENFLVLNADNIFWLDLEAFLARHREVGAHATIAAIEIPVMTNEAYELLLPDPGRRVLMDYVDRSRSPEFTKDRSSIFVSSGWYAMTPSIRDLVEPRVPFSNEIDLWPRLARSGRPLGFYHATEPWFDSGTHERLARIEAFLQGRTHGSAPTANL